MHSRQTQTLRSKYHHFGVDDFHIHCSERRGSQRTCWAQRFTCSVVMPTSFAVSCSPRETARNNRSQISASEGCRQPRWATELFSFIRKPGFGFSWIWIGFKWLACFSCQCCRISQRFAPILAVLICLI